MTIKEKICLYVPLHITSVEDIYMANMQSRFFHECKNFIPNIITVMSIDKDSTRAFNEKYVNSGTDMLLDMREKTSYGIVEPTFAAIDISEKESADILIRITQDTQILDIDKLVDTLLDFFADGKRCICGKKDTCSDISNYLSDIGIIQKGRYDFVQGNFIMANTSLWSKRYKMLPDTVRHYCDDSIFSYLCENIDEIKPTFVKRFWEENRTKDILYLESLFSKQKEKDNNMHGSSYEEMARVLRTYLDMYTTAKLKVVDVGSFDVNGTYKTLMPNDWEYIGVDIIEGKNVDIVMKDPYTLPFEDNSINIIISGQCLEHVQKPWELVKEMWRVLDPGGHCFITAPSKMHLHSYPHDYWRFHPEGMRFMLEDAGFDVKEVYTFPPDGLIRENYGRPWTVDCWGVGIKK